MIESKNDYEVIATALNMWANHIETSDVNLSVQDAHNCGQKDIINPLTETQQEFIRRLKKLSNRSLEISSQKKMSAQNA